MYYVNKPNNLGGPVDISKASGRQSRCARAGQRRICLVGRAVVGLLPVARSVGGAPRFGALGRRGRGHANFRYQQRQRLSPNRAGDRRCRLRDAQKRRARAPIRLFDALPHRRTRPANLRYVLQRPEIPAAVVSVARQTDYLRQPRRQKRASVGRSEKLLHLARFVGVGRRAEQMAVDRPHSAESPDFRPLAKSSRCRSLRLRIPR